jgi:hypothetical protein
VREAPVTRRQFQKLADLRAQDAAALVKSRRLQAAYYLAGYAVECALKACIAKETKRHEFPPKWRYVQSLYTHELENLLRLAGLEKSLDVDSQTNATLAANWGVVKQWREESRYILSGLKGKDICTALTGPDGVLTWIKQRW